MSNRICEACFSFLAIILMACGLAAALFISMLLMPFAFITVLVLAVREVVIWKRNEKLTKEKNIVMKAIAVQRKRKTVVRYMPAHNNNRNIA